MRATDFEFRNRWWVFSFIFAVAFTAYVVDPINAGAGITNWVAKQLGYKASDNDYRIIFAVGALLVAAAAMIRTWATSYLHAEVMRDGRIHTEKVVADGPYRYVRNPLYLANILMAVGVGLMASRSGFVILVVGMTIFVIRLLLREENELRRDRGEAYRLYFQAVPRLLPSPLPRISAGGNAPRWGQGFRAESMYWMLSLAVGAFAITLNIKYFWGMFLLAMASSFFYKSPAENSPANRA